MTRTVVEWKMHCAFLTPGISDSPTASRACSLLCLLIPKQTKNEAKQQSCTVFRISELHQDAGFFQRLTKLETEFPGANIMLHKLGRLPPVCAELPLSLLTNEVSIDGSPKGICKTTCIDQQIVFDSASSDETLKRIKRAKLSGQLQAFRNLWSNERLLNLAEQLLNTKEIIGHPVWNLRTKTPKNEATTVPWHQGLSVNISFRSARPSSN